MHLRDDVHIEPTSGCWLWVGETQRVDVALANVRRKTYSEKHERPQAGMCPRPSCGCYWCVNPDHMTLSTPKTKADRQKKWEAKNRQHRAAYLKQYVDRNRERLNEQQNLRNFPGWARIIQAVVVCAQYTISDAALDASPVGLVPDQWVAKMLDVGVHVVVQYRRRRRISAASLTVYETCGRCLKPFQYSVSQGGRQSACGDCIEKNRNGGVDTSFRKRVYARDGGICRYCGVQCSDAYEVDHIVPWSAGGWDSVVNYALSCRVCNQVKGAQRLHVDVEWRMVHDNLERRARRWAKHGV